MICSKCDFILKTNYMYCEITEGVHIGSYFLMFVSVETSVRRMNAVQSQAVMIINDHNL